MYIQNTKNTLFQGLNKLFWTTFETQLNGKIVWATQTILVSLLTRISFWKLLHSIMFLEEF